MNIPNLLTSFRILLVPVYLYLFFTGGGNRLYYTGIILIIAGITDVLDGFIARRFNQMTKLGAVLDPLADKLMSFAILISFTYAEIIPSWVLIVMGLKELSMIVGAIILYLFKDNRVMPANKYGKLATFSFYVAIMTVILSLPAKLIRTAFITTVVLNIVAFVNYFLIFIAIDIERNA